MQNENLKAQEYFVNLENDKFASYRIKELLLFNAIHSEKIIASKFLDQLNMNDLNIPFKFHSKYNHYKLKSIKYLFISSNT